MASPSMAPASAPFPAHRRGMARSCFCDKKTRLCIPSARHLCRRGPLGASLTGLPRGLPMLRRLRQRTISREPAPAGSSFHPRHNSTGIRA
jgi:hypothetical protein